MAHTNVEDTQFPNDRILADDYKRDVVGCQQDVRDCFRDASPAGAEAVIVDGGNLLDGTTADTFKVTALRARDNAQFPVVVAADVDNVAPASTTEDVRNYVAVKHKWAYSSSRPAYDTSTDYYASRADDYEVNVATSRQDEANGYVVLGAAYKHGAAWIFDFTERTLDLRLCLVGFTIYVSWKEITPAGVQFARDAARLSELFSWEDKVVLFQLADGWSDSTSALPVDLQTTTRVTTDWQVIGQLNDAGGVVRDISVKVHPAAPQALMMKAATNPVNIRGMITLLGGDYNAETTMP